jgi:hypothetical protein
MSKSMGQPIIVENRPGAGGNTGTAMGAKAAPDGYTLIGGGSGPVAANLTLYKTLGYDPAKDLEMISQFAGFTIVVVVSRTLPVRSVKELIDLARANPGKLNYGSVGIGSSQHLAAEHFAQLTGTRITHVCLSQHRPIRRGPDQAPVLGFQWYPNVAAPSKRGRDPAAVAGDRRLPALPDSDHDGGGAAGIQVSVGSALRTRGHAEADPGSSAGNWRSPRRPDAPGFEKAKARDDGAFARSGQDISHG